MTIAQLRMLLVAAEFGPSARIVGMLSESVAVGTERNVIESKGAGFSNDPVIWLIDGAHQANLSHFEEQFKRKDGAFGMK